MTRNFRPIQNLRPFTSSDWDGFAGAMSWRNKESLHEVLSQPLIGDISIDGEDLLIIIDKDCAQIHGYVDTLMLKLKTSSPYAAIQTVAIKLTEAISSCADHEDMTTKSLLDTGWEKI